MNTEKTTPQRKERGSVWLFILISFLWSWLLFFLTDGWLVPMLGEQGNLTGARLTLILGHMLAMCGPALAAWILWRFYHKEAMPVWKWGRPWQYIVAALAMLALWGGLALAGFFSSAEIELVDPIHISIWMVIAISLTLGWGAGIGEEMGWCTYLLSRLTPRIGKARATLISGILRGVWHLPVVIIPSMQQYVAGEQTLLNLIVITVFMVVLLSVTNVLFGAVFAWLWYRTGSTPLLGWLHQWFDLVRDAAVFLLVGFSGSVWHAVGNMSFIPLGILCLILIMRNKTLSDGTRGKKEDTLSQAS
ncbi:MAG: CPBP family intramembrane metalloprotease [Anaerolineae bacterium]|nr:CPBP family intramembrane metalloprotease [Anaerolineae bacterium]